MVENEADFALLESLVAYLEAWDKSYSRYQEWYEQEWASRLARYKKIRSATEQKIAEAARGLDYDKEGRVRNDTTPARRKIEAFKRRCDIYYANQIMAARHIFGVKVKVNPATQISEGQLEKAFRVKTADRLRDFISDVHKIVVKEEIEVTS